jgi:hypothetical protein
MRKFNEYTVERNRKIHIRPDTRKNPIWAGLRSVIAGDKLTIVKAGKVKVWTVQRVIGIPFADTVLHLKSGKEFLTFSWRNARDLGITAVCHATEKEIKASETKPARKPAPKVVKALAKVASNKRAKPRKGKASAVVNPYIAAMRKRIAAIARGA